MFRKNQHDITLIFTSIMDYFQCNYSETFEKRPLLKKIPIHDMKNPKKTILKILEDKPVWGPTALEARRKASKAYQSKYAEVRQQWITKNSYYYNAIKRVLQFIVEPDSRVLDIRCQTGFLLNATRPSYGVGLETSPEFLEIARRNYPQFEFIMAHPEHLEIDQKFDYILFENISDTADIIATLERLKPLCEAKTRLIILTYNPLWEPVIKLAERFLKKIPTLEQNWLSEADMRNMFNICGFEWLRTYRTIFFPKRIFLLSTLLNLVIPRLPVISRLCMINVLVARLDPVPRAPDDISVSVIVPCKNEKGNIQAAVERIPDMGRHTEVIFCDDKSDDGTADEVRRMCKKYPERDIKLIEGPGICKAKNVWTGFESAQEDVLMILDADLTVMPEELPYFFQAIVEGKGELINGSRLIYPVPKLAMKFLNMIGNKIFSIIFSSIIGQRIKDTLCGTKVLWRSDWERIKPMIGSWGIEDQWGDYELLFGAAKLHLKIVDLPVHYQERVYGTTKMINVFKNGFKMVLICFGAFKKIKMEY